MSQKLSSAERVPQTEEDDFGGDEEDIFVQESRDIGAEFVRLLIGDVGPTSKGPGDGRQGTAANSTDEKSGDCRSASAANVCTSITVEMMGYTLHVHVYMYSMCIHSTYSVVVFVCRKCCQCKY